MLPNNSVLNALASLCGKLETDERFPKEKRKEAQELFLEHRNLVERHYETPDRADLRLQIEAQAEHLGMAMVGLLAQLLQLSLVFGP
jgi:hypothetical protein